MLLVFVVVFGPAASLFFVEEPATDKEGSWVIVLIWLLFFGAMTAVVLVSFAKTLVVVGPRGLRVDGRGWLAWEQILDVQVEDVDERIFPIEAPVLRLDVPSTHWGPAPEEALTGLAGYRILSRNRRVWRDANRIRRWAQLPPLPLPPRRPEAPPQGIRAEPKGCRTPRDR